jgi:hypothetical protein
MFESNIRSVMRPDDLVEALERARLLIERDGLPALATALAPLEGATPAVLPGIDGFSRAASTC